MKWNVKLVLLTMLCFGCKPEHATLPPGWKMMCDHKGHYVAARATTGQLLNDYTGSGGDDLPYPSKQAAIDRAWGQYDFERRERPKSRTAAELGLSACED